MLLIDVLDRQENLTYVRFDIGLDVVETRMGEWPVGAADRDHMRAWLRRPVGRYIYGKVELRVVPAGIALSIGELLINWVLSSTQIGGLLCAVDVPRPDREERAGPTEIRPVAGPRHPFFFN